MSGTVGLLFSLTCIDEESLDNVIDTSQDFWDNLCCKEKLGRYITPNYFWDLLSKISLNENNITITSGILEMVITSMT